MNKKEWPWNNRPSSRHVWKVVSQSKRTGVVEHCLRCDAQFIELADTCGPVHCFASKQWLASHHDDDGMEGP